MFYIEKGNGHPLILLHGGIFPNAELAIIPKADHYVYETKSDLFNSIVLKFLMIHK
ncbi:MAG: alpha/beta hydrolase [Candidatus Heimdallarchaeota archaeon]|nr:alpha/beta hydrolase [Candidatus Heimdallarchaeota archaeon]